MMWKSSLFLLVVICGYQSQAKNQLKITVYYETLSEESKDLLGEKLPSVYKDMSEYLELEIVPAGFSEVKSDSKTLEFSCLRGPDECYGNKAHSCALALLPKETFQNFVFCSMAMDASSDDDLMKCSEENGLSWSTLHDCTNGEQGSKLLLENILKTRSNKPRIIRVPSLFFNDVFNKTLDDAARESIKPVVCNLLKNEPAACRQ